jgi:hypothetical protein
LFHIDETNGCFIPKDSFLKVLIQKIHIDTTTIFWLNLSSSINLDRFSVGGGSEKQESLSRG